jgi:hypothetical protein
MKDPKDERIMDLAIRLVISKMDVHFNNAAESVYDYINDKDVNYEAAIDYLYYQKELLDNFSEAICLCIDVFCDGNEAEQMERYLDDEIRNWLRRIKDKVNDLYAVKKVE